MNRREHGARSRMDMLRRHFRLSLGDGLAHSVMVGVGETYLPAFALALGMPDVTAGLVATLPLLVGGLVQLVAPLGIARVGSYRRWTVCCAALQAASFLPLVIGALLGRMPGLLLFACAALYWAAGMSASPAWNVWIGRLIPPSVRSGYFGFRQSAVQAGALSGLVCGGIWLQHAGGYGIDAPAAFAALFGLALVCRAVSTAFLRGHADLAADAPPHGGQGDVQRRGAHRHVWRRRILPHLQRGRQGRVVLFLVAFNASVAVASAFFTPYMLRSLALSYTSYMLLTASSVASKVVALPLLGRVLRRTSPRRLLIAGAAGVAPLPALWLVSNDLGYLLALQLVAGVVWAAFELGTFLLFFDVRDERERTDLLSLFNGCNAVASAGGSLAGGALLHLHVGAAAYHMVFLASAGLRAVSLLLVMRIPAAAWRPWRLAVPALRVLGIRPSAGTMTRPVIATAAPEADADADADPGGDPDGDPGGEGVDGAVRKAPAAAGRD